MGFRLPLLAPNALYRSDRLNMWLYKLIDDLNHTHCLWSGGHVNLSTIYIENRRYSIIGRGCWLLTAAKWSTTLQHDVLVHVSHSQDVRRYTIGLHHEPVAQSVEHMTF